jgi:uncharacterized glyoxalase superfamily protein PhnB
MVDGSMADKERLAMKFSSVTPNLMVSDVGRSVAFYRDVLGFTMGETVPDAPPFAFAWMRRDGVSVFLNSVESVRSQHRELGSRSIGGTATIFIVLEAEDLAGGIDALYASAAPGSRVFMELKNQFYGMREFAVEDPDGYVIFFAQRIG